jgi:hypothetical protein
LPVRIFVSRGFTPLASIRTSTCPAATFGRATSINRKAELYSSRTAARIVAPIADEFAMLLLSVRQPDQN